MNRIFKIVTISFLLFLGTSTLFSQETPKEFAKQITTENLKKHVYTLASEEFKGRETGSEGQKMAAEYIANEFKNAGLLAGSVSDVKKFYQPFELYKYSIGKTSMMVDTNKFKNVFFFASNNFVGEINTRLVFGGFGDVEKLEKEKVADKALFILADSVGHAYNTIRKINKDFGTKEFLVSLPSRGRRFSYENISVLESYFSLYGIKYFGTNMRSKERLEKFDKYNKLLPEMKLPFGDDIKVVFVNSYYSRKFYDITHKDLVKSVLKNENIVIPEVDLQLECNYTPKRDTVRTENVIGYIEGTDKKDEVIVVCGHYDHVGVNWKDKICYGADDNASGTGAVIELAKTFGEMAKQGKRPSRSIVFIAFSGEERGLLGSKYYVENPLFPLKKTVLCVNIDMIGRNRKNKDKFDNSVFVFGSGEGKKYKKISASLNKDFTNLKVDKTPGLKERIVWKYGSDHRSFAKKDIPVFVAFTGLHPDYHRPADTPDNINYDKYTRITQLMFCTVWHAANE